MTPDEFRRHAHDFVDWMADYMAGVGDYPVRSQVAPGDIAAALSDAAPDTGEPLEDIFADFQRDVMPGITHWQHPRFFAYFPANGSPPSVLAEMLTAAMGVNGMLWETSPAATEMETRVLDWLRQMIGLPEGFHGVIQDTASSATLCALLAARDRATAGAVTARGLAGSAPLTVYSSGQAHTSVDKGAIVAGYGRDHVRHVPTDDAFRMDPVALDRLIEEDLAAGLRPACIVATLGTTGLGAIDPLADIAAVARTRGLYLHVDAAWAGSACVLPEHRWMIEGIEHADSFVFNPHKWLMTNFDCSAHFVRDPEEFTRGLTLDPSYLKNRGKSDVIDYRNWGVPLGRRFRALKLWFVLRSYGTEGLAAIVGEHIRWTAKLAARIEAEADFELLLPPALGLINFRYLPAGTGDAAADDLNRRLLAAVNDDGTTYITGHEVAGRYALRLSIGQTTTTEADVDLTWNKIGELARAL